MYMPDANQQRAHRHVAMLYTTDFVTCACAQLRLQAGGIQACQHLCAVVINVAGQQCSNNPTQNLVASLLTSHQRPDLQHSPGMVTCCKSNCRQCGAHTTYCAQQQLVQFTWQKGWAALECHLVEGLIEASLGAVLAGRTVGESFLFEHTPTHLCQTHSTTLVRICLSSTEALCLESS